MMVRVSGSESRPVAGSVACKVITFEPGTSSTVISNSPFSSATTRGFSGRLLTVTVALGSVLPRTVMDVSGWALTLPGGSVMRSSGVRAKLTNSKPRYATKPPTRIVRMAATTAPGVTTNARDRRAVSGRGGLTARGRWDAVAADSRR
jgi:hypothetical protein